jgi:hypothetical protein
MNFYTFLKFRLLSVFFTPARYRVVKIAHSYCEIFLRTTKDTTICLDSDPYLEIIVLLLTV